MEMFFWIIGILFWMGAVVGGLSSSTMFGSIVAAIFALNGTAAVGVGSILAMLQKLDRTAKT